MQTSELLQLFADGGRRAILIGDAGHGVIAGLDLEGRLYPVLRDEVLTRVNPAALAAGPSAGYANPGGDGLWPAPEGTGLGWHYATGAWRVPPGLTGARWQCTATTEHSARIEADIDLINAIGLGVPLRAARTIQLRPQADGLGVLVEESFTYRGTACLGREDCLLAPWTLCQFDCRPGCETVFPDGGADCVWDLYGPSEALRHCEDGLWHVRTDGSNRFQLGLSATVPWIEFRDPARGLRVRRSAGGLQAGHGFIDIADRPPGEAPDARGCRYSVYSDANGFMEIEAAGGMPVRLEPDACLSVSVSTVFHRG